jgi:acetyl-CoA synthetase
MVLRSMGVKKGDRVTIYMGRVPELPIAMLACAKIGAVHSVVYGGFSVEALHGRIEDSQSNVAITCDGSFMNGKIVELKKILDEAIKRAGSVEHVIVYKRTGQDVPMEPGRDYWYHDLMALPIARAAAGGNRCDTEVMDAEDPLYMLYTSGTTGKPKAIVHTHGGYMVGVGTTLKTVFDLKEDDRYWCAADPGWVTGHSYIVYGPLLLGATSFMYEGAPTFPYPNRWWSMVEKYGINVLYMAPTAIRGLMRFGEAWPNRHDLSSLRLLGSVGEPINPEAWRWYHRVIGKERCPIMDTWWQTETGMFMITPLPVTPLKPGSATRPFPGIEADVVDEAGNPVAPGEEGYLVLKKPWPAMLRTLYKDPDRYVQQYWSKYPGLYFTGDSARKDEDGYFWIIGRVDDVIKVSGYRLGTAEIESALVSHPAVAEAAAIGLPHEVKGNAIHTWVILKAGYEGSEQLIEELKAHGQAGKDHGRPATPQDAQRQDHAPRAARPRAWVAGRGCDDAGRVAQVANLRVAAPIEKLLEINMSEPIRAAALDLIAQRIAPGSSVIRSWLLRGGISARMTALELRLPDGAPRRVIVREPQPLLLDESGTILPASYLVIEFTEGEVEHSPPAARHSSRR